MVKKAHIVELVNRRVTDILDVAEAALPPEQFRAFRKVTLNAFGRKGLEGELDGLRWPEGVEGWEGQGRNT